jgi:hypothetical protein
VRIRAPAECSLNRADSEDEEIAEAADEAMAEAEVASDEEDDEEDEWIN